MPVRRRTQARIVCLCGSTQFMEAFHEVGWRLTLDGVIVLTVGVAKHGPESHAAESLGDGVARQLDELHLQKIDLADEIMVLNVDGYVGQSTAREILYAMRAQKTVSWLDPRRQLAAAALELIADEGPMPAAAAASDPAS